MASTGICVQVYSSVPFIQQQLAFNGYRFKQKYIEYDNYYTPIPKSLVKTINYATLIQNTILLRNVKGEAMDRNLLVYKNKTLNNLGEVIKEEKVQTQLGDIEEAKRVFSLAGMNNWCRIVVEEIEFIKDEITISIQHVPGLGNFLEISELTYATGSSEDIFREMIYIANSLGLDVGKDYSCKKNYMLYQKLN